MNTYLFTRSYIKSCQGNYTINLIEDIKSNKKDSIVLLGQLIYATNLDGSNKD